MICPICTPTVEITWADLVADQVELCEKHSGEHVSLFAQSSPQIAWPIADWAEKHRFLSADLTTARHDEAGPFTSAVLAMICTLPRKSK